MYFRCAGPGRGECPRAEVVKGAARCPRCAREWESKRRPSSSLRYDAAYRKRRLEAIADEPWCHNPHCRRRIDARNPLTADHSVPVSLGGAESPLVVLCKACNSSRGARPWAEWIELQRLRHG